MHGRRPPARHQEHVTGDFSLSALMPDADGVDPQPPVSADDLGACDDFDARCPRGIHERALGLGAQIDDERDVDARRLQVERRAIGAVVCRRDDDAVADLRAILTAITSRGIGKHDGRAIIVRKDERTLDRARRQHHLARAHLP